MQQLTSMYRAVSAGEALCTITNGSLVLNATRGSVLTVLIAGIDADPFTSCLLHSGAVTFRHEATVTGACWIIFLVAFTMGIGTGEVGTRRAITCNAYLTVGTCKQV